jgi:hypothetical protein
MMTAARADRVTIDAMLILASDDGAPLDHRLERVEYKLRRIFGFEYYRYMGEASAIIHLPGRARLDLGHGYSLNIEVSESDGKVRALVRWMRGDEELLATSVRMKKKTPAILGGPEHGNGTLIVTLTVR